VKTNFISSYHFIKFPRVSCSSRLVHTFKNPLSVLFYRLLSLLLSLSGAGNRYVQPGLNLRSGIDTLKPCLNFRAVINVLNSHQRPILHPVKIIDSKIFSSHGRHVSGNSPWEDSNVRNAVCTLAGTNEVVAIGQTHFQNRVQPLGFSDIS